MRYSHFALRHSLDQKNAYQNWSKQVEEATVTVQLRGSRISQESTDTLICTHRGPRVTRKPQKKAVSLLGELRPISDSSVSCTDFYKDCLRNPALLYVRRKQCGLIKTGGCLGQQGHSNVRASKKYCQFNVYLKLPKGTINGKHCLKWVTNGDPVCIQLDVQGGKHKKGDNATILHMY